MGLISYFMRHKKADGTVVETARLATGAVIEKKQRCTKGGRTQGGYWQLSQSNGILGTDADLRKAVAMDRQLGVTIDYVKKKTRNGRSVWLAAFDSATQKRAWLKAHKRFDLDAGFRDPCPGDFRGQCPPEFEGKVPE